jgi:hypothetical protein
MADPMITIARDDAEGTAFATVSSEGGWRTLANVLNAVKAEEAAFG